MKRRCFVFLLGLAIFIGAVWEQEVKANPPRARSAERRVETAIKTIEKDLTVIRAKIEELKKINKDIKQIKLKPFLKLRELQEAGPLDYEQLQVMRDKLSAGRATLEGGHSCLRKITQQMPALKKGLQILERDIHFLRGSLSESVGNNLNHTKVSVENSLNSTFELVEVLRSTLSWQIAELKKVEEVILWPPEEEQVNAPPAIMDPCWQETQATNIEEELWWCLACCDIRFPVSEETVYPPGEEPFVAQQNQICKDKCYFNANFANGQNEADELWNSLLEVLKAVNEAQAAAGQDLG